MDTVYEDLLSVEEDLGTGSGEPYRRHLAPDAIVVVPGAVLTREECAAAMDASPGWDDHEITDVRTRRPTADTVLLTYRWRSRRGGSRYTAVMSSVYAHRPDGWRLVLHQQTPEPDETPGA